jgi:hypothetical protein
MHSQWIFMNTRARAISVQVELKLDEPLGASCDSIELAARCRRRYPRLREYSGCPAGLWAANHVECELVLISVVAARIQRLEVGCSEKIIFRAQD